MLLMILLELSIDTSCKQLHHGDVGDEMGEENEVLWASGRLLGWVYMLWACGIVDNCG